MAEFEEVYSQYFDDVYRYALYLCRNESMAEELTQETFFKALKSIEDFKGESKLSVWLCQIAKHTYFSMYKKNKRFSDELSNEQNSIPDGDSIEQKLISSESAVDIHRALHSMDEPYKEVFSLRMFGELPFYQIAGLFGKTESWARVTFHRAKLKLKEELK